TTMRIFSRSIPNVQNWPPALKAVVKEHVLFVRESLFSFFDDFVEDFGSLAGGSENQAIAEVGNRLFRFDHRFHNGLTFAVLPFPEPFLHPPSVADSSGEGRGGGTQQFHGFEQVRFAGPIWPDEDVQWGQRNSLGTW